MFNQKAVVLFLMFVCHSFSAGMVISNDPSVLDPVLLNQYVNVSIEDDIASVLVVQEFQNMGDGDLRGKFIFPMPEGGVSEFSLHSEEKRYVAKARDSSEALEEFQLHISERKDASLIGMINQDTLAAELYFPKNKTVTIKIKYKQAVQRNAGMHIFSYPLHPGRYHMKTIDPINISLRINSDENLSVIHSPTHPIDINRASATKATAEYYESKAVPNKDFVLMYSTVKSGNDVKIITQKKKGEDGYFMMFLHPRPQTEETNPKDIVFVIDVSGSMSGEKIHQAKTALLSNLENLGEDDRFNIISFNDKIDKFSNDLQSKSRANQAKEYVRSLYAEGKTNLYNSQMEAVNMLEDNDGRTKIVVFLTDGMDTTQHSTDFIIEELKERREGNNWRIYPLGIGRDLDFELISSEANEFGDGVPIYVESNADIEKAMTGFYNKISVPALTDVTLDLSDFAYEVYPVELDNLYVNNTVLISGKYKKGGNYTISLKGKVSNRYKAWFYSIEIPKERENPFVERAWAVKKIGYLMDQINLEGESTYLKNEVKFLGNKYALATPYTSLLVKSQEEYEVAMKEGRVAADMSMGDYDIQMDDLEAHGDTTCAILSVIDVNGNILDKLNACLSEDGSPSVTTWISPEGKVYDITIHSLAPGYTFGSKWTELTLFDHITKSSVNAVLNQGETISGSEYTAASDFESGDVGAVSSFEMFGTQLVKDKIFIPADGRWLDTSCTGEEEIQNIEFGSDAYFDLLKDEEVSDYLSTGENVLVCFDSSAILVFMPGNENLSHTKAIEEISNDEKQHVRSESILTLGDEKSNWSIKDEPLFVSEIQEGAENEKIEGESRGKKQDVLKGIIAFFKAFFNLN